MADRPEGAIPSSDHLGGVIPRSGVVPPSGVVLPSGVVPPPGVVLPPGVVPPSGVIPSSDAGYSETNAIYGAVITVTILATIAVIFRFVARKKSKNVISYDDYSIVLALVFLYGLSTDTIITAALWGLGKNSFSLQDENLHFGKNVLANFALYSTTNATIKISLLLLYYRLFSPSRSFRIALYATAVIVIAWWIAVFFAGIFQCVPVKAFWDFELRATATCMSTLMFPIGTGVTNLVTDLMVLCLPMPMVWSLQTNRAQKFTLTGIFLLGFFVCVVSIIRIVKLATLEYFDLTYSLASVYIWTAVEPSVGIICACLPIMRPLFGRWLVATVSSRSKSSKPPSSKKTTFSSHPTSASSASPVKGRFTRLDGPTSRYKLEASYAETSSSHNGSVVPVADGSYGDKEGRSWVMYRPSERDSADGRLEEGRGKEEVLEMREWEWEGRRESSE